MENLKTSEMLPGGPRSSSYLRTYWACITLFFEWIEKEFFQPIFFAACRFPFKKTMEISNDLLFAILGGEDFDPISGF
jgi:hypothetical protein